MWLLVCCFDVTIGFECGCYVVFWVGSRVLLGDLLAKVKVACGQIFQFPWLGSSFQMEGRRIVKCVYFVFTSIGSHISANVKC